MTRSCSNNTASLLTVNHLSSALDVRADVLLLIR